MSAIKVISLLMIFGSVFLLINWIAKTPDFFIKNEISLGPTKASFEITPEGRVALSCAMGPYVGRSGKFREASKVDLENNILAFGNFYCRGDYFIKNNRAKILTINPGEYYRTVSAEFECTEQKTPELDVEPKELCRSILNFDDPISLE